MEWNVNGMNTDMEVNVEGGVNWNDPCHDASLEKKFTSLFALHVNMFMHIVRCTCNYGWDGQPWQLTWATQIRTTRNEMGFLKPPGKADGPTLHLTDRTLVILSLHDRSAYEIQTMREAKNQIVSRLWRLLRLVPQRRKRDSLLCAGVHEESCFSQ